ncbi:MAG: hypothetical protein ACJAXA_003296, partial [Candidatus Aldehydirespiratoraceae bacterium]
SLHRSAGAANRSDTGWGCVDGFGGLIKGWGQA